MGVDRLPAHVLRRESPLWQLASWRPRFTYSRNSLKRLAGFGSNIVGSRFLDFVQTNMDNILVGRYLGSAALGLYSVAYNVILIPLGRLFAPISNTLFAAASRMQDEPARVAGLRLRAVRGALSVILPAILGLLVVRPNSFRSCWAHNGTRPRRLSESSA